MTTLQDVAAFRSAVGDLTAVALDDVAGLLGAMSMDDPVVFRNFVLDTLPELVAPYLTASEELAAVWYEELRNQVERASFYAVTRGRPLDQAQVDAMVRRAMAPLFGKSDSDVFTLLSGSVQRLVSDAARNTVIDNVARDRIRVGYARIPQAGCCAFCAMLASRGAVYRDEMSAGGVTGRGMEIGATEGRRGRQAQGVKTRGKQNLGDAYHDFCRCTVAPVFMGDTFAQDTAEQYLQMYQESVKSSGRYSAVDTKATLAEMRREHGLR